VLIELVIALNFRSLRYSIFTTPPHRWLLVSVFLSILITFLLIQFPHVRDSFGITFPSTEYIEIVLLIAVGITGTIELAKLALKKRLRSYR
jgi:Ca2+-transporting ATPase